MKEKENITIMEDAKEYDNSIILALKLISETLDNHNNKINGLLEIVDEQNKIINGLLEIVGEQNKIIEKLTLKINILELINLKDKGV